MTLPAEVCTLNLFFLILPTEIPKKCKTLNFEVRKPENILRLSIPLCIPKKNVYYQASLMPEAVASVAT
jgi:hypothetical protein